MNPFGVSKGFGPQQLFDLVLELLDFAFQHNSRPERTGQGQPLLLDREQALQ